MHHHLQQDNSANDNKIKSKETTTTTTTITTKYSKYEDKNQSTTSTTMTRATTFVSNKADYSIESQQKEKSDSNGRICTMNTQSNEYIQERWTIRTYWV